MTIYQIAINDTYSFDGDWYSDPWEETFTRYYPDEFEKEEYKHDYDNYEDLMDAISFEVDDDEWTDMEIYESQDNGKTWKYLKDEINIWRK